MNLQDIIAYALVGIIVAVFVYIAWASRKEKNKNQDLKNK